MPYIEDNKYFLSEEEVTAFKALNHFAEIGGGGLLQGPSFPEGGIKMVRLTEEGKYQLFGRAEGWQYLMNSFATVKYQQQLHTLNEKYADLQNDFMPYHIPQGTRIINTAPEPIASELGAKFLLLTEKNVTIINKYSAYKYLPVLEQINAIGPDDSDTHIILGDSIIGA